jgi:hypothetical protein
MTLSYSIRCFKTDSMAGAKSAFESRHFQFPMHLIVSHLNKKNKVKIVTDFKPIYKSLKHLGKQINCVLLEMCDMREDSFDNFVYLMHLLRENSEANFCTQLKLVAMYRCRPKLQRTQKGLKLLLCKWIVTLHL